jgi:hypothetical protein
MRDASFQELWANLMKTALFIEGNRMSLSVQVNLLKIFLPGYLHKGLLGNRFSSPEFMELQEPGEGGGARTQPSRYRR